MCRWLTVLYRFTLIFSLSVVFPFHWYLYPLQGLILLQGNQVNELPPNPDEPGKHLFEIAPGRPAFLSTFHITSYYSYQMLWMIIELYWSLQAFGYTRLSRETGKQDMTGCSVFFVLVTTVAVVAHENSSCDASCALIFMFVSVPSLQCCVVFQADVIFWLLREKLTHNTGWNLKKRSVCYLDVISFMYTNAPQFRGKSKFQSVSPLDKRFNRIDVLPWKRGWNFVRKKSNDLST